MHLMNVPQLSKAQGLVFSDLAWGIYLIVGTRLIEYISGWRRDEVNHTRTDGESTSLRRSDQRAERVDHVPSPRIAIVAAGLVRCTLKSRTRHASACFVE